MAPKIAATTMLTYGKTGEFRIVTPRHRDPRRIALVPFCNSDAVGWAVTARQRAPDHHSGAGAGQHPKEGERIRPAILGLAPFVVRLYDNLESPRRAMSSTAGHLASSAS